VVYARLIIDGKDLGVHEFMVQLRDETHKPMPGVDVGDIGPKVLSVMSRCALPLVIMVVCHQLGYNNVDNG
jgi:hypothetical protein